MPFIQFLDPFLTGASRSVHQSDNYHTQYETNFYRRPESPVRPPLRRPTNLKLSQGSMDIFTEQKSQYLKYTDDVYARSRPPMIKYPNNLKLSGDIELLPEYRQAFVPYDLEKVKRINNFDDQSYLQHKHQMEDHQRKQKQFQPIEAKIKNNNYGVSCMNRYYEKLDTENNYLPEYKRNYKAMQGEKSKLIPQGTHFTKNSEQFNGISEYNNRYKYYDHFTKSAPIKKQDNLNLKGSYDMRPEYNERYKPVEMNKFEKRSSLKQQDNIHLQGGYPRTMPEYHESYKDHNITTFPERAKAKKDYLRLGGEMDYNAEYRNSYKDFPRNRPSVTKPPSNIKLASNRSFDEEQAPRRVSYADDRRGSSLNRQNYHNGNREYEEDNYEEYDQNGNPNNYHPRVKKQDSDENDVPLQCQPEYRKAYKNYMLKERSPSRIEVNDNPGGRAYKPRALDKANEALIVPLKPPPDFHLATRDPNLHSPRRAPTYPIDKRDGFVPPPERTAENRLPRDSRGRRLDSAIKVSVVDCDGNSVASSQEITDSSQEQFMASQYDRRRSPKFGRRAPNPTEEYNIRSRTKVIEGNPNYVRDYKRDIQANRHQQSAYCPGSLSKQPTAFPAPAVMPIPYPDEDVIKNHNYLNNYEFDKQQQYREYLGDDSKPFVVINKNNKKAGNAASECEKQQAKSGKWMKSSWLES